MRKMGDIKKVTFERVDEGDVHGYRVDIEFGSKSFSYLYCDVPPTSTAIGDTKGYKATLGDAMKSLKEQLGNIEVSND